MTVLEQQQHDRATVIRTLALLKKPANEAQITRITGIPRERVWCAHVHDKRRFITLGRSANTPGVGMSLTEEGQRVADHALGYPELLDLEDVAIRAESHAGSTQWFVNDAAFETEAETAQAALNLEESIWRQSWVK